MKPTTVSMIDASHGQPPVQVLMGVSGCGKSTVAGLLAGRLGWDFEEDDDLHPAADVDKDGLGAPTRRRGPVAVAGEGL
jgi:gluconokinase